MRIRKQILVASLTIVGAVAGIAGPASAAPTDVTFTLTGGVLTLGVEAVATLTDEASGVDANTITGDLGEVTVDDARGTAEGWIVSAVSTAFTGTGLSVSTGVEYTSDVSVTGDSTVVDVISQPIMDVVDPFDGATVATATSSGNNTASWTPTLDVFMPAGALAGDYEGTVTTSIL